MLISKKTVVYYVLVSVLLIMLCSALVYSFTVQSLQVKNSDLKGTYQFDIRNINNPEYLAVIETNESEGKFQWYNATNEMLKQGTCKIDKGNFVTFYVDNLVIGMIVITDDKYYFIDESFEHHEISKISDVPRVVLID